MSHKLSQGLREFADFLDAHPEFPLGDYAINVFVHTPEEFARFAKELTGEKHAYPGEWFFVTRMFGKVQVDLNIRQAQVCTKRVVGTRTVTEKVPVTFEERTREEEIVEWDCPETILEAANQ